MRSIGGGQTRGGVRSDWEWKKERAGGGGKGGGVRHMGEKGGRRVRDKEKGRRVGNGTASGGDSWKTWWNPS